MCVWRVPTRRSELSAHAASSIRRSSAEAGANRRCPGRWVAGWKRFRRFVVNAVARNPAGALQQLTQPQSRLREVPLASERPPGETAAKAREQRAEHRPLTDA